MVETNRIRDMLDEASALLQAGHVQEAEATGRKVLILAPETARLGILYAQSGHSQRATECLNKMLQSDPHSPEALFLLSQSDNFHPDDRTAEHLAVLAERTSMPRAQKVRLHFALGKIYEDRLAYDEAFKHYERANTLKRETTLYDRRATTARIDSLIRFFDENRFRMLVDRFATESDLPAFVLGMPRSGTTLVEQILASHPEVHGAGELEE